MTWEQLRLFWCKRAAIGLCGFELALCPLGVGTGGRKGRPYK